MTERRIGRYTLVGHKLGPIVDAACWAHGRRKFFDLARISKAPIAEEAVARIDALFAIEREINGLTPQQRVAKRHERSRPLGHQGRSASGDRALRISAFWAKREASARKPR